MSKVAYHCLYRMTRCILIVYLTAFIVTEALIYLELQSVTQLLIIIDVEFVHSWLYVKHAWQSNICYSQSYFHQVMRREEQAK